MIMTSAVRLHCSHIADLPLRNLQVRCRILQHRTLAPSSRRVRATLWSCYLGFKFKVKVFPCTDYQFPCLLLSSQGRWASRPSLTLSHLESISIWLFECTYRFPLCFCGAVLLLVRTLLRVSRINSSLQCPSVCNIEFAGDGMLVKCIHLKWNLGLSLHVLFP